MAEGGTCHYKRRNCLTEAHSLSGDGRGRDLLGQENRPTDRGALTNESWIRKRKQLVRTRKQTDRSRCTHVRVLDTAEEGTCQDKETDRPIEVHSRPSPGYGRGRNLSGQGNRQTNRGALTSESWIWQRKKLVRTRKQTDQSRCTHF